MTAVAFWRRLDTPGHDAALLTRRGDGWSLEGTAVFRHPAGPARVGYCVETDAAWRTLRGTVRGFVAANRIEHTIVRAADGWYLDGAFVGLAHLCDLDLGFTPATNVLQLRRAAPRPGQSVELPVAWFDVAADTLVELPQCYAGRARATFWYTAPTVPYEGLLELAENGFVRSYPQLWAMDA